MYPKSWKKYCSQLKEQGKRPSKEVSRFSARYRMAKAFTGAGFTNIAKDTVNGFNAAIRVQLAANSLEALERFFKKIQYKFTYSEQPDMAKRFRSHYGRRYILYLEENLDAHLSAAKHYQKYLREFHVHDSKQNNVLKIAKITRNLFAHGKLTSGGAGLTASPTLIKLLNDLSSTVLDECDRLFEEYIEKS